MYKGYSVQYKVVPQNKLIDLTQFVKSKLLKKKVLIKIRNGPENFFSSSRMKWFRTEEALSSKRAEFIALDAEKAQREHAIYNITIVSFVTSLTDLQH